jgi:IS1 family transposase
MRRIQVRLSLRGNGEGGKVTNLLNGRRRLFLGGFSEVMSVRAARDYFVQSNAANRSQNNGKEGNNPSGAGRAQGSLVGGCILFIFGAALLKLSFYLADGPHTFGSRLLYVGCGLLAVASIWESINLVGRFIVTRKHLHSYWFSYYNKSMPNILSTHKQIAVIASLCEGSSIRSIERITGVHRDTIMRLGVRVGQGCAALMDDKMHNLPCTRLELDEIWGFIGKKDKHVRPEDDSRMGDVWTFCAIDADTKLVPAFKVGKRDSATANEFVADISDRMRNRVQISTDGLRAYVEAVENAFGGCVDYAQIIKTYGHEEVSNNRRYSAPEFVSSEKKVIVGMPEYDLISTSYVERLNATTRLHMRRLTRLTLAFSKKWENFEAAVGLHFAYYNFVKRHNTLRCTPAMAAGVTPSFWSVADLVEASA